MKSYSFRYLIAVFLCTCCGCIFGQDNALQEYAQRLQAFGKTLPQEHVYVHMDNNCYYLGDTIYYKAYIRRSDTGTPSNISGVLYAELLNHDGYLVQRQMLEVKDGEAIGSIALHDTLYSGYYELRAYTRWQLNWGVREHRHSRFAEKYFFNKKMARDYYRDYDKLYSRVFPVYDKPQTPGEYFPDMTLRPLSRHFRDNDNENTVKVSFYPEGGGLVAGTQQRVAWEARNGKGQYVDGVMTVQGREYQTLNRGRGVMEVDVPESGHIQATFQPNDDACIPVTQNLPKIHKTGARLRVDVSDNSFVINIHAVDSAAQERLGITIMKDGVLKLFATNEKNTLNYSPAESGSGVYQVTVFNRQGRVYADRLVFYRAPELQAQNIIITGIPEESMKPYEMADIQLQGAPDAHLSVSVRDAACSEYIYDNASIMAEMLLSSEVRGFIPDPDWFFENDDEEHRVALDLLMMTQGWRRYVWREMAVAKTWELLHRPESRYQLVNGGVYNYELIENLSAFTKDGAQMSESSGGETYTNNDPTQESDILDETNANNRQYIDMSAEIAENANISSDRFRKKESSVKPSVVVHAEWSQPGTESVLGEMPVEDGGLFTIKMPRYFDKHYFFLAASDTLKWSKKDKDRGIAHTWIQNGLDIKDDKEMVYPEFYVKVNQIYPRFVKPYDYYQKTLAPAPKNTQQYKNQELGIRTLNEVTIDSRRKGRMEFIAGKPAFVLDAYEAFNATVDAGLCPGYFQGSDKFITDVTRAYIGDMGMDQNYPVEVRYDGKAVSARSNMEQRKQSTASRNFGMTQMPEESFNISTYTLDKYRLLSNLSDVYIYTDYAPRREGDANFEGSNQPIVRVDLKLMPDDSVRSYQVNRRWIMDGFSIPDEFYNPDYSTPPLPKQDFRRTLYWNPNVVLDSNGHATVRIANNSTPSILQIDVEGWTGDGTLQHAVR